ncbi:MAG: proton-conducting transporter membrane subunit, partial [Sciscionella sp.]
LTLAFYLLTAHDRTRQGRSAAAVITVVLGKASGGLLALGFLLLAGKTGSFMLETFAGLPRTGLRDAAYALLVAGFAVKVGVLPLHVWMPRGYAAAPGPLRAVMAGVAVNVGFYGMWRTLELLGKPPAWLVVVLLLLAGCTAILGIVHSTVQTDLTEVIAYSSVENGGLITIGYAIALVGAALSKPQLIAVGLLTGTLQMIAHAIAKSLLFCATSGIESATGTTNLDDLRGVGHRLKWSGGGLAVGAITLAGLPLTLGFVSEWFLLESLMQQFRVGHLYFALPLAVAGALVALTAGFAAVAFVRIVGLTVLGPRGWHEVNEQADVGALARCGLALLALGCVGLAAITPLEVRTIIAGLSPVISRQASAGALASPWVLQPVYPDFSILSPSWLAIAMPVLFVGVLGLGFAFGRSRMWRTRRVPAWRSATSGVAGENQYTPFAFANPTRKVLANVLLTRSELRTVEIETGGQVDEVHRDAAGAHLGYTSDVVELVERYLYQPLLKPFMAIVRAAKRMQNGRLDAYVGYMLIAFIAVLAVVVALP